MGWNGFWALLASSPQFKCSSVSQVLLCFPSQLRSVFPIGQLLLYDSRTPSFDVCVSIELRLPIGSPSGCLREPPSCVCWTVCNYPQASLGQCSRAPPQAYTAPPTNEPFLLELQEQQGDGGGNIIKWVQVKDKRLIKTCKQEEASPLWTVHMQPHLTL